ncbi:hypothetical protein B0J11DRAFT_568437 [Dendryphion nanum]|uniref:Major facilitator superfamily transporter n=1 Tax=Dendryphion nanum TaxID=256645 RepID=A0A9P9DVC0_9PLEO|nr:hypothetical protein B0J11DRAFT_568437 [Dendryphion nanum]
MLGFRPLAIGKRKPQRYNQVPHYDVEDRGYAEKRSDSDSDGNGDIDDNYATSATSSPSSSRAPSGTHLPPRSRSISKPAVSAYSYKNPRAFTRYFGLALGTTILLFMFFLLNASWTSVRNVEMGFRRPPPPEVWRAFPFLKRYHGGIRTLTSRESNVKDKEYPRPEDVDPDRAPSEEEQLAQQKKWEKPSHVEGGNIPASEVFNPYPDYQSLPYIDNYGPVETCYLDANDTIQIPPLRAYKGVTAGTPENVMGSYDLLELRNDICFERFGRLGPYGLGYSKRSGGTGAGLEGDREGIEQVWRDQPQVDFRELKWGEVVERCIQKNIGRFTTTPKVQDNLFQAMPMGGPRTKRSEILEAKDQEKTSANGTTVPQPKAVHRNHIHRSAVLIRTWWDYNYDEEDILFLRALVSELTLQSGGEYTVHFLIHVKDDNLQIWADDAVYQDVLSKALPAEFAGMGTLWSERQMSLIYGGLDEARFRDLPVYGAYRSTFLPVTYFAHQHPEFEYFWQWEMDVRYTGHYYHLFTQIEKWAAKQPRKGLWERNSRFYVPSVHGTWEEFSHMVRVQTEHGTNSHANKWSSSLPPQPKLPAPELQKPEKPIWGPELPHDYPEIEIDESVKPNTTYFDDKGTWGVGEQADLIVLNPLFDPDQTNWILAEDVTGYNRSRGFPPRRTAINTSGRLSRRLLMTMHREQTHHRRTMFSEMWPGSCALHHGLKAVYAPHPVFIDRKWPVQYLAAIFNNGRNGASGGARLSVFSDERQHNFLGTTWYYHAGFAGNLWKRWLGYKVDGDGGEVEELGGEGRMCLPGVLLHPVKQVDMVFDREGGGKVDSMGGAGVGIGVYTKAPCYEMRK